MKRLLSIMVAGLFILTVATAGVMVFGDRDREPPAEPLPSTTIQTADETLAVHEAFRAYQDAVRKKDWSAMADLTNAETFEGFDQCRTLALSGEVAPIREAQLDRKLLILWMRFRVGEDALRILKTRELFLRVVASLPYGARDAATLQVAKVSFFAPDFAVLSLRRDESPPLGITSCHRENGVWKVNAADVMATFWQELAKDARTQGHHPDMIIATTLAGENFRDLPEGAIQYLDLMPRK